MTWQNTGLTEIPLKGFGALYEDMSPAERGLGSQSHV